MKSAPHGRGPALFAGLVAGGALLLVAAAAPAQTCDPSSAAREWAERAQLAHQTQRSADAARAGAEALGIHPPLSIEVEAASLLGDAGEADLSALAVWTRDFARSRTLSAQLGELRAAEATGGIGALQLSAAASVLGVFDRAMALRDELDLAEAELTYLREVLDITRTLVDGGEVGELDVLRVEHRLRAAALVRDTRALELEAARRTLAAIAPEACPEHAPIGAATMPLPAASPRLTALEATMAALQAEGELAARSARPELRLGAGPRLLAATDGTAPGLVVALSVTPGRVSERRLRETQLIAETDRVSLEAQVESQRTNLALPWIELAEQLELRARSEADERAALADRIDAAIRLGYAGGELDLSAVLDAHDSLALDARALADVRARARMARLHALSILLGDAP